MPREAEIQLIREGAIEALPGDAVFREHWLRSAVFGLPLTGLGLGFTVLPWFAGPIDDSFLGGLFGIVIAGVIVLVGLILLLAGVLCLLDVRAAMRPSNWRLRLSTGGLYLHYRSYRNDAPDDDGPVAAFLPWRTILWARGARLTTLGRDSEGYETKTRHDRLELKLPATDAAVLATAVAAERSRPGNQRFGFRSHSRHYPVRVRDGAVVEIDWSGSANFTRPGLARVLELLAERVPVLDGVDRVQGSYAGLSRAEQENQLIELASAGDVLNAVKIAQELYGYSLTEAKGFVDGLTR